MARIGWQAQSRKAGSNPLGQARVKVTGVRLERFVEFEFSLNDDDLTVELIMPFDAFECFCRDQGAIRLPSAIEEASGCDRR